MRERQNCCRAVQSSIQWQFFIDQRHLVPDTRFRCNRVEEIGDTLCEVNVSREDIALGDGDHRLTVAPANELGQLVAKTSRQLKPACRVPTADQSFAPLFGDELLCTFHGAHRARSERVAVKVDNPFGQDETVPKRCQRIRGVDPSACVTGDEVQGMGGGGH
ncbi:hypothetical protein [Arthrobacter sp. AQ5-05]|uniref:hypothetical protein n=1 Tax=Arthrobacter sp. AQ5-05 TaxID=2184581 RepID=UPI0018A73C06|nr:hypothetical protein [Arthrobacter sp. AQ5-05]